MIEEVLTVIPDPQRPGVYHGPQIDSVIPRTFGGQVASQSLRAAQLAVAAQLADTPATHPTDAPANLPQVHSFHSYFVGPADSTQPLELHVSQLRAGRSFNHQEVRAYQGTGHKKDLKYVLLASFHHPGDSGPAHQDRMPDVDDPETLAPVDAAHANTRLVIGDWSQWDIRPQPRDGRSREKDGAVQRNIWFRNTADLAVYRDDEAFHRAGLAYMADMTIIRTALIGHEDPKVQMASLDHTIWFHRPVRINEWMLYSQDSPAAGEGTGLTRGAVYNANGHLLATVAQEGLIRHLH
ncbi:thioesterase family protein [Corynebacterium lizhenjunii]|uniref:Thioesterase family protein n=1 Tax=Corynebacterium lizhenjunii TaxID=2709394 RepID=A0A7T0KHN8_9CORY|nr:thioesterase family protein [Corynebacterium lizhenjunii]